jgi:hypothetical protein
MVDRKVFSNVILVPMSILFLCNFSETVKAISLCLSRSVVISMYLVHVKDVDMTGKIVFLIYWISHECLCFLMFLIYAKLILKMSDQLWN